MARWRTLLRALSQSRHLLKTLDRLADATDQQATALTRLADFFCGPVLPAPTPDDLKTTGVSYSRDSEQARLLEYVERVHRDTGRDPTEEELVAYLDGRVH